MQMESVRTAGSFNRLDGMLAAMEAELVSIISKIEDETSLLISREFRDFHGEIDRKVISIEMLADVFREANGCIEEHIPLEYE